MSVSAPSTGLAATFRWTEPVLITTGNHEAYTLPYGISPRVQRTRSIGRNIGWRDEESDAELVAASREARDEDLAEIAESGSPNIYSDRANAGIPGDHNLSIPEAILMYGPDYARVVADGSSAASGRRNFRAANLDWFHLVFTPFSDGCFRYGAQQFLALAWGDDETFVSLNPLSDQSGAILPRASGALDRDQRQLVQHALAQDPVDKRLLLTHFTLINYDSGEPVGNEGRIRYHTGPGSYFTRHDAGTFEHHRDALYQPLAEGRFHYTLSGHSHRSGLYHVTGHRSITQGPGQINATHTLDVRGQATAPSDEPRRFDTRFIEDRTRVIVSPSGGPIAVQNHDGELLVQGREPPGGTLIRFAPDGEEREIRVVNPRKTVTTAKPRLAAVLDHADTIGRDADPDGHGVFRSITAPSLAGPWTVTVNPRLGLPGTGWIDAVELHVFAGKGHSTIKLEIDRDPSSPEVVKMQPVTSSVGTLKKISMKPRSFTAFLTVHLSDAIREQCLGHYSTNDPWHFRVEIVPDSRDAHRYAMSRGYRNLQQDLTSMAAPAGIGWVMRRHGDWGEIPELRWYSENFPGEYGGFKWEEGDKSEVEDEFPE